MLDPTSTKHILLPKPILKQSPSPGPHTGQQKHAHFPPPDEEAKRYSGVAGYDRTPIVVLSNDCQLPERGCPGRTFFEEASAHKLHKRHGKAELLAMPRPSANHPHPRILNGSAILTDGSSYPHILAGSEPVPLLVHFDTTSESEDSDGITSPPSEDDRTHTNMSHMDDGIMLGAARVAARSRRLHRPSGRETPTARTYHDESSTSNCNGFLGSNSCLDGF